MVIRMRKAALFLVISLVAAVISLETTAQAGTATFPSVAVQNTWFPPAPGFGPVLGKIAKDSSDNIYVTDVENRNVVKFDAYGNYLKTFNFSGYGRPYGLAVMKNGTMVLTFIYPQPRVVLFGPDGSKLLQQGGLELPAQKFQSPLAVALDSLDNIYVLDAGSFEAPVVEAIELLAGQQTVTKRFTFGSSLMCVQVFNKDGVAVSTGASAGAPFPTNSFGSPSRLDPLVYNANPPEDGAFMSPEAIIYDPIRKMIAVGDTLNGRVQFFGAGDNATTALRYKYIYKFGDVLASDLNGMHMSAPTGVALENAATGLRAYVVDKVLKRVRVVDPDQAAVRQLGLIDEAGYPALDLVYPRDMIWHRGNLLIANEQGPTRANLLTIGLDGAPWPPVPLTLTFDRVAAMQLDANFPNIGQRAGNTFTITGKVSAGATVTWMNNQADGAGKEFSGSCSASETGADPKDYSCLVTLSTTQFDQDIVISAVKGVDNANLGIEHINYDAANALPRYNPPLLTFNTIPAAEQYRQSNTITISGTVDYSTTGDPANRGKELKVEIVNSANSQRTYALVDTTGAQTAKTWTATIQLVANATNTLTPAAYVELSRRAATVPASQNVIVDTVEPGVSFSFYKDGTVVLDQVQNAAGTVADVNLESVTLKINGTDTDVKFNQLGTANSYYFSTLALLNLNGVNELQVVARDKAGNVGSSMVHTVDLKPMLLPIGAPRLTVTSQADNLFYTKAGVDLAFAGGLPNSTTDVMFGTEIATVAGSTWSHTTNAYVKNYTEEVVPITIEATTSLYGKISKLRSLYVHSGAPTASVTQPVEDVAVNATSGTGYVFKVAVAPSAVNPTTQITSVVVELTDSTGVAAFAPQTFTNLGTAPITVTTTATNLTVPGVYVLKATVSNGIESTVTYRNVLLDKTKPSVGIALDSATWPLTSIQGFVEPGATVTVTYNGSPLTVTWPDPANLSNWKVSGNFTEALKSTLIVTATDVAGNTNTRTWQAVPTADVDGDGSLRVYDAIVALRAVVSGATDAETMKYADIAPVVNGLPAPDGLLTMADAQLVLMKVEGKPWPTQY